MSRYADNYDDDSDTAVLNLGRWEHNSRAALKGRRGRKALAELRDALLALPEKRLIDSAMCTVGDVDTRFPVVTDEKIAQAEAKLNASLAGVAHDPAGATGYAYSATWMRTEREDQREAYTELVRTRGHGVCAIGAYLWHQRVKAGADPAEAFEFLPVLLDADDGDPLSETAELGRDAGLTFTLAWELAYRNDETYARMTPEERYTAFLAWIDAELGTEAAAS